MEVPAAGSGEAPFRQPREGHRGPPGGSRREEPRLREVTHPSPCAPSAAARLPGAPRYLSGEKYQAPGPRPPPAGTKRSRHALPGRRPRCSCRRAGPAAPHAPAAGGALPAPPSLNAAAAAPHPPQRALRSAAASLRGSASLRARGRRGPARPCRPRTGLLAEPAGRQPSSAPPRPAAPRARARLPARPPAAPPPAPRRGPARPVTCPAAPRLLRVQTGPARLPGTTSLARYALASCSRRRQRRSAAGDGQSARGGGDMRLLRGGETRRVAKARLRPPRPRARL